MSLEEDLEDLVSAEDFLTYFGVPFDQSVVHVNRLHILQRFHDYLSAIPLPEDETAQQARYVECLTRAYGDFVNSDAATEKVFKVFQQAGPQTVFVPVSSLRRDA